MKKITVSFPGQGSEDRFEIDEWYWSEICSTIQLFKLLPMPVKIYSVEDDNFGKEFIDSYGIVRRSTDFSEYLLLLLVVPFRFSPNSKKREVHVYFCSDGFITAGIFFDSKEELAKFSLLMKEICFMGEENEDYGFVFYEEEKCVEFSAGNWDNALFLIFFLLKSWKENTLDRFSKYN